MKERIMRAQRGARPVGWKGERFAGRWAARVPGLQPEPGLGVGDRRDERLRGGRVEEAGAVGRILQDLAQGAHHGEVVSRLRFRGAEHEEQPHDLALVVEIDPGVAAAHGHDDALHVLGAGVRQRDAVAERGGVEPVAGEQLLVEAGVVGHLGMVLQLVGDLVQRGGPPGAPGYRGSHRPC